MDAGEDGRAPEELAAALERERLLATIGREAAAARDMIAILEAVLIPLAEIVRFKGGSISLIEDGVLALAAARGLVDDAAWRVRVPVGTGISGWVAATGHPYRSDDLDAEHAVLPSSRNVGSNALIRSYLAVPLIAQGRVLGILQVDSAARAAFNAEHEELLQAIAAQVAEAVERVRADRGEREQIQTLERENDLLRAQAAELRPQNEALRDEATRLTARNEQLRAQRRELAARAARIKALVRQSDQRAAELERTVARLKEVEQGRDDFISMVSHDLRTPITSIKGLVQLTAQRLKRENLDRARALAGLGQAEAQIDRLVALVNDLLDVSRIQGQRLELRRAPLDLMPLLRGAVDRLQATTAAHTLRLGRPAVGETTESATGEGATGEGATGEGATAVTPLWVDGDARRLDQVLDNLLTNAIKYSLMGGAIDVEVRIAPRSPRSATDPLAGVAETAEEMVRDADDAATAVAGVSGDEALVSIRDRGIGIPLGDRDTLFERFGRAANAAAQGVPGFGLGLYISRAIAEQHGGRLWLADSGDAGSTFVLALPLRVTSG